MDQFPRTDVGGISLSRMIIGTNWFLGYSHTSGAKDRMITSHHSSKSMADVMEVFFKSGIDTVMGPPHPLLIDAVKDVQDRTGIEANLILTPHFNVLPGGPEALEPERVFEKCRMDGAKFCFPHMCVTDIILDRLHRTLRGYDEIARMIRAEEMIPGLSTHLPESVVIADESGADVETYIQIYNAAGFLMTIEADWALKVIREAKKPVMTIKPLAAGRLLPLVGLSFVWNTLRDEDMVTIGAMTPDEAREVIDLSLDILNRKAPVGELQQTRSKKSLEPVQIQEPPRH